MTDQCDDCDHTGGDGTNYPCKYCTESDAIQFILKHYPNPTDRPAAEILMHSLLITWKELQQHQKNYFQHLNK